MRDKPRPLRRGFSGANREDRPKRRRRDHPAGEGPERRGIPQPCRKGHGNLRAARHALHPAQLCRRGGFARRFGHPPAAPQAPGTGSGAEGGVPHRRRFLPFPCRRGGGGEAGLRLCDAGPHFPTDCKKGLPPRGLELLREVCAAVSVPVFAIGGISAENIAAVKEAGAAGACVMSGFMRCADPAAYLREFRKAGDIDEIQP